MRILSWVLFAVSACKTVAPEAETKIIKKWDPASVTYLCKLPTKDMETLQHLQLTGTEGDSMKLIEISHRLLNSKAANPEAAKKLLTHLINATTPPLYRGIGDEETVYTKEEDLAKIKQRFNADHQERLQLIVRLVQTTEKYPQYLGQKLTKDYTVATAIEASAKYDWSTYNRMVAMLGYAALREKGAEPLLAHVKAHDGDIIFDGHYSAYYGIEYLSALNAKKEKMYLMRLPGHYYLTGDRDDVRKGTETELKALLAEHQTQLEQYVSKLKDPNTEESAKALATDLDYMQRSLTYAEKLLQQAQEDVNKDEYWISFCTDVVTKRKTEKESIESAKIPLRSIDKVTSSLSLPFEELADQYASTATVKLSKDAQRLATVLQTSKLAGQDFASLFNAHKREYLQYARSPYMLVPKADRSKSCQ